MTRAAPSVPDLPPDQRDPVPPPGTRLPFPCHPGRGRKAGVAGPPLRCLVCVQTAREAFEKLGALVVLSAESLHVFRDAVPVALLPLEGDDKKPHVCARQYRHAARLLWHENLSRDQLSR